MTEESSRLHECSQMDIRKIDQNTLADINTINIDTTMPFAPRMQRFLNEIQNPYCFRCGKAVVKVSFKKGRDLEKLIGSYFINLKGG